MAEEEDFTHFQFDFGGISLELSGERAFVEQMYRQIMNDVELVRTGRHRAPETVPVGAATVARAPEPQVLWIHRCSEMMRKIYMATTDDIDETFLAKVLNSAHIGVLYIDKGIMHNTLSNLEKGNTLWAEFTEAGRQKLAEVSKANRR
ncbi:MAG: hypothetical protein H0U74_03915 [Bradymonadaceae bacterium]|nr:hypothetical protein [Lujinxingiaceae bacterium]